MSSHRAASDRSSKGFVNILRLRGRDTLVQNNVFVCVDHVKAMLTQQVT
jgi:hypothetical protein